MSGDGVGAAFARRRAPAEALAADARRIAEACHDMARRFHRGGKLVVFGTGSGAADALHVSVEFMHPVIVGKRALPALSLCSDVATLTGVGSADPGGFGEVFAHQLRHLAAPEDIALAVSDGSPDASVRRGLAAAGELGLLRIALTGGMAEPEEPVPADHVFRVESTDPHVVKEVQVTTYHVLWELVHVFFEQPGVLDPELVR